MIRPVYLILFLVYPFTRNGEINAQTVPVSSASLEFSCLSFPAVVSESALIDRFGAENVISDSITGSDDGPFVGTVVYPNSDETRIEIAWQNSDTRDAARWIRVQADESIWATAHGIRVGSDLLSIERVNGWPFRLRGFWAEGWGGGAVLSWGEGRLANYEEEDACSQQINFQPRYDGTISNSLMKQVRSLREVSSGHPAMQRINPRVATIWLIFPRD